MFAVIDVETTGGHLYDDRITEIAIYKTDGYKLIDSFSSLINPQRKITPFVVKLTGINDDMVQSAPLFADVAEKILEITKDCIFVAHNIGFDYSMVKREFKRIGISFRRQNVCTVQLSQRVFKNQSSYSLGNLCKNLNISINNRHRAFGDAEATAILLKKILEAKGLDYVIEHSNAFSKNIKFNGFLTQEMIDVLPEDPGVFRFIDKKNQILYIGSAKNIFLEVTKQLKKLSESQNNERFFDKIHLIDTQVFNSVIIAKLQEIEELRTVMPAYNKASTYKKHPFGIFETNSKSSPAFYIERSSKGASLWRFSNERSAKRFLKKLLHDYKLNSYLTGSDKAKEYRKRVENVLQKELYPYRNFFILREVSFANTIYAIYIQDYSYVGYAEIDKEFYDGKTETLKENIIYCENNPFVLKALKRYISKKKNLKIIKA